MEITTSHFQNLSGSVRVGEYPYVNQLNINSWHTLTWTLSTIYSYTPFKNCYKYI